MALRIAFFYACGMFSGTISGLLAYAISFMNGLAGLAGWRWMFILYVAACIALTSSRCLKSQTVNSPTAKVSPPYFAASTPTSFCRTTPTRASSSRKTKSALSSLTCPPPNRLLLRKRGTGRRPRLSSRIRRSLLSLCYGSAMRLVGGPLVPCCRR
jgi:MFS family permease